MTNYQYTLLDIHTKVLKALEATKTPDSYVRAARTIARHGYDKGTLTFPQTEALEYHFGEYLTFGETRHLYSILRLIAYYLAAALPTIDESPF